MLRIKNLTAQFGKIKALHQVSLEVHKGEIVVLIGANGAGKTTLLNCISGIIRPTAGQILFEDKDITLKPPPAIVALGIGQVPEGRQIFNPLTVKENLELGAYLRYQQGEKKEKIKEDMEQVFTLFPRLKERLHQLAGTLSGGEQQMLAIARALMARPKLLLLDEPTLGLAPLTAAEIIRKIASLRASGMTILLVEQNAHLALEIANRGYVLETGRVVLEGKAKALLNDERVKQAYLGGK